MSYISNNLRLRSTTIGNEVPAHWDYSSADAAATVAGAGYLSDAQKKGMKVNDIVTVLDTGTPLITSHRVSAVSSTGATLSAGVTIGNT